MKKITLVLTLLLISFWTVAQSPDKKETSKLNKQIGQKIHCTEFIDGDNTPLSQEVIQQVKKELYNNAYILGTEDNDWQGIQQVQMNEIIRPEQVNEFHPNMHQFKDFLDYTGSQEDLNNDVEKIVITFHSSENYPNFNHISFKKRGHQEWQNYSNAGNFEYPKGKEMNDTEVAEWLIRIIVGLTFK